MNTYGVCRWDSTCGFGEQPFGHDGGTGGIQLPEAKVECQRVYCQVQKGHLVKTLAWMQQSFTKIRLPSSQDDAFSSEKAGLTQVTNKCTGDDDLEYFVSEAADLMGISQGMSPAAATLKHILE